MGLGLCKHQLSTAFWILAKPPLSGLPSFCKAAFLGNLRLIFTAIKKHPTENPAWSYHKFFIWDRRCDRSGQANMFLYSWVAPRRLPGDHPIPAQCHSRWWVRHVQTSRQPKRFWCGTNLHRLSRTSALRPPLLHAPTRFLAVVCDSGKPRLIKFHNPRTSFKLTLDFWATYILTSPALLHMWRCMPMLACSLCLQTERRYFLPSRSSWLSTKLPNKSKFEYNLGCELWVLFSVPRSSRLNNLWQQKKYKSTSKFFRGSTTFTPLPSYPEDSWKLITADILRKSGNWGV